MKSRLISLISSCFISISVAHAALSFSEIMYDPEGSDTNREWVEIRNDGDAAPITSYKLFESNTNHNITPSQGGSIIPSGGYAVIADDPVRFLQDFPSYSGILFDSSFSLSNAGEFLSLKDSAGQILDSLTYSPGIGGSDDGTSLSIIQGVWVRGDTTPGTDNVFSSKPLTSSASSTKSQSITALSSGPAPDLTIFVPEERLVIAGADSVFTASALMSSGAEPSGLSYEWSFGDGGFRIGKSVTYRYSEPGFYIVVVEATNSTLFAKNRIRIHVVQPSIFVTNVQKDNEKFSISLSNPSQYELDIGSWKLSDNGVYYPLPKNTILLPRATTTFNALEFGMATGTAAVGTTSIYFPRGQILASSTYIPQHFENDQLLKKTFTKNYNRSTPSDFLNSKGKSDTRSSSSKKSSERIDSILPQANLKKDKFIINWIKSLF